MTDFGTDIACVFDADELFSECSGLQLVYQDAIHRITTDSVLGPGGDGWGKNCIHLIGLPLSQLAAEQTSYAEALCRDERIDHATVRIEAVPDGDVIGSATFTAECYTALGPFRLVMPVGDVTAATFEEL